ncbi:unnamed protein product [Phyllotreta striolata]|uniref:OCIA domain-containing protein n=1 Tax=Phyllotreta striolata TaxID=444603 RepID=A0A9N9XSQ7_PHYSR|nr:unnamed protein product [Phyllotreta striolata]
MANRDNTIREPGRTDSKGYQFSPEEIRVLKECNKESFYKRCLPLSTLLAGSTYYAVKAGFLKGSPRFGPTPKVCVAVIVGYFIGKFSYQNKCAEKLMQLPQSKIGEMLRQKRRGNIRENIDPGFGAGLSLSPFSGISPSETYSDISPYSSLDIDTSRPENPGLDDYYRPSLDNPVAETLEEMPPERKYTTTYEELRLKNREEYKQQRLGNINDNAPPASLPPRDSGRSNRPNTIDSKNKYGDSWETVSPS